jgi:hypothetical protein
MFVIVIDMPLKNRRELKVSPLRKFSQSFGVRVRSTLLLASILPTVALSILSVVFVPSIINAYPADVLFWGSLIVALYVAMIAVGSINYFLIIRNKKNFQKNKNRNSHRYEIVRRSIFKHYIVMIWIESFIIAIILCHVWLHVTNPYAQLNFVQQPYVTEVNGNTISAKKQFDLHVASGPFAEALGYYKSGFLIVQNAWFGSYFAPSRSSDAII